MLISGPTLNNMTLEEIESKLAEIPKDLYQRVTRTRDLPGKPGKIQVSKASFSPDHNLDFYLTPTSIVYYQIGQAGQTYIGWVNLDSKEIFLHPAKGKDETTLDDAFDNAVSYHPFNYPSPIHRFLPDAYKEKPIPWIFLSHQMAAIRRNRFFKDYIPSTHIGFSIIKGESCLIETFCNKAGSHHRYSIEYKKSYLDAHKKAVPGAYLPYMERKAGAPYKLKTLMPADLTLITMRSLLKGLSEVSPELTPSINTVKAPNIDFSVEQSAPSCSSSIS